MVEKRAINALQLRHRSYRTERGIGLEDIQKKQ